MPLKTIQVEGVGEVRYDERVARFNGIAFPRIGKDAKHVAWRLRYVEPSNADLIAASDIVSAYLALIVRGSAVGFATIRKALLAVEHAEASSVADE